MKKSKEEVQQKRKYRVKIFTSDFKVILKKYIEEETKEDIGFLKTLKILDINNDLRLVWNYPNASHSSRIVYFKGNRDLKKPKVFETLLDEMEEGKVLWNNEIMKISEIDDIYSYKLID